jgi:hypothetical protein
MSTVDCRTDFIFVIRHSEFVISLPGGDYAVAVDCHRQDEAVVVVDVFADEVDAARRGDDPLRRATISLLKAVCGAGDKLLQ